MNYEPLTVIPRYRVVGTEWIDTGVGIPAAPGQEFDSRGWPKSDSLEPVNEAAKRTRNYWRKNRAVPTHAYPSTPWSEKLNRIFLPHLGGRDTVAAVPKDEVLHNMPAYRALQDVFGGVARH